MPSRKKTIGYTLLASVVVIILGLASLRVWVLRGGAEMFSGRIVSLEPNRLTLLDPKGNETIIITDSHTKIKQGIKEGRDKLMPGTQIFAVGVANEQGEVRARMIRIFKHQ